MIATKPDLIKDNNFINNIYEKIKSDPNPRKILKAAHMSDVHMDYDYVHSADEPFGCYSCGAETPYSTLYAILNYMKEEIKPDMLVWTGDNSKSDTWGNTEKQVIDYVVNITNTIKEIGLD
jgi:hypothetical protein